MLRHRKGFTLVEIMIVVAIIALLAAIAIPNLLRARHNANETAAVAAVRTISTACESWRAVNGTYPTTAQGLAGLAGATPPYIDATLGAGTKQGYTFAYTSPSAAGDAIGNTYHCTAVPQVYQTTGTRSFLVQEDGVIRGGDNNGAVYARGGGNPIQ